MAKAAIHKTIIQHPQKVAFLGDYLLAIAVRPLKPRLAGWC